MEFSDEYIRMCDCPELQGLWQPQMGDWICKAHFRIEEKTEYFTQVLRQPLLKVDIKIINDDNYFWLPLMYQLWEMLENDFCFNISSMMKLYPKATPVVLWVAPNDKPLDKRWIEGCIDECLLKALMWVKFHKVWNGEAWVEEGENAC